MDDLNTQAMDSTAQFQQAREPIQARVSDDASGTARADSGDVGGRLAKLGAESRRDGDWVAGTGLGSGTENASDEDSSSDSEAPTGDDGITEAATGGARSPTRTSRVRRCSLTRRPDGAFRVSVPAGWVYGVNDLRARKHNARVSRVLRREDGTIVRDRRTAERMAAELAEQLMPVVPGSRTPFGRTAREGHPIGESLDRFVASYADRDPSTASGIVSGAARLRVFLSGLGSRAPRVMRDLDRSHGVAFREWVATARKPDGAEYAAGSKDRAIEVAMRFLNWAVEQGVLDSNPWKGAKLARFKSHRMRDRVLADDKRILFKNERERLYAACRSTDERLMLLLLCLTGLRNGEVAHLTWGDYKRHDAIKRLHIRRKGDWIPKTGERLVPLYYPEVVALMEQWRSESPFGIGNDDWVFQSRRRADCDGIEVPRRWIERLRRETGIPFSPLVGRHTACSLFPLYVKQLTSRDFTPLEHAQVFGHDFKTSQRYYITASLIDLAAKEGLDARSDGSGGNGDDHDSESHDADGDRAEPDGALTPSRAKAILRALMTASGWTIQRAAQGAGVSQPAISRWLAVGKSVPLWWYRAMDVLTATALVRGRASEDGSTA